MVTGTRVRFTQDYYITNELLPPRNWAGVVDHEVVSAGRPTKFVIVLDERYRAEAMDTEVEATEDELLLE